MKRMKFIGLLVLSLVLLASTTASAGIVNITAENLGDYDFATGSGTVEIVDTTSAVGTASDLSLKMVWPASSDDSGILITDLGNPTISSISGFSYWENSPQAKNPHLAMYLDTDGIGGWDTLVRDNRLDMSAGDVWVEFDSSGTMDFYVKKTGAHSTTFPGTWADFQVAYPTAVVKQIQISHAGYSVGYPATVYLDDFSFGGTQYVFSNVPEPATVSILGFGSIVLLLRKKH